MAGGPELYRPSPANLSLRVWVLALGPSTTALTPSFALSRKPLNPLLQASPQKVQGPGPEPVHFTFQAPLPAATLPTPGGLVGLMFFKVLEGLLAGLKLCSSHFAKCFSVIVFSLPNGAVTPPWVAGGILSGSLLSRPVCRQVVLVSSVGEVRGLREHFARSNPAPLPGVTQRSPKLALARTEDRALGLLPLLPSLPVYAAAAGCGPVWDE